MNFRFQITRENKCNVKCWQFFRLKRKNFRVFRDFFFFNFFKIFLLLSKAKCKAKYGKELKILSGKQILQWKPIAFAQVKAVNTSENVLHEIRRIMYSLYQTKEITKKVYNNIMNSIKLLNE